MKYFILFLWGIYSLHSATLNQSLVDLKLGENASEYLLSNQIDRSQTLAGFIQSGEERDRSRFFSSVWKDAYSSKVVAKQRDYTDVLVAGLEDSYFGTWILKRLILPPFEKESFTDQSKSSIASYEANDGYQSNRIRLFGIAEVDTPLLDIEEATNKGGLFKDARANELFKNMQTDHFVYYDSARWTSLLVHARRGNDKALNEVIEDITNTNVNDLVGLPDVVSDLGYVRQPAAIDLLVEFLFSEIPSADERLRGDSIITPLSYHAIKGLSQSLIGFPVKYWDPITEEGLEDAREFIRNYEGSWRIIGKWEAEEPAVEIPALLEDFKRDRLNKIDIK
jgi:hypothetical protein